MILFLQNLFPTLKKEKDGKTEMETKDKKGKIKKNY